MTNNTASKIPARSAAETMRYAKVWKALVSGRVPTRREDVREWYRAAQHVIGIALHEAHLGAVCLDVAEAPSPRWSSAA